VNPALIVLSTVLAAIPLGPGDCIRTLQVDGRCRSYIVHIPPKYDPQQPTPVVLAFHGAGDNAEKMVRVSRLNEKADQDGFIAVYPSGTGRLKRWLSWNGGNCWPGRDVNLPFLGKSAKNISASDLMWEFFKRHLMTEVPEAAIREKGADHP
jgi:poly(3-hydroxybutyrate) depolymerase